jgi:hypothetical protein
MQRAQSPNQQQGQPLYYWKQQGVLEKCDRIKNRYRFTECGLVTARRVLPVV